eukprot:CAMPEP_0183304710 /NCGR_PEP_ID=MMETSP0160_2-20130417/9707_1 /TAXON_ID=2839 ORGANISM="Odontella Sinensis, Strain Grunow 1884" /NCGR_SAMPLE_ID=MMETSP0160_2 /ASSEMBLY_ACC=CAM_ASM_000250 /LENGTH=172 /DNA_ID=CAMNT_0025467811 /DNA_START=157 /DNA_END=675 /DNA_ORIENTATION=-
MANPQLMTAIGAVSAMFLSSAGSCYGSVHGGVFALEMLPILGRGRSLVPIFQSGVLAIYGLIITYLLSSKVNDNDLTEIDGYRNLASGLVSGTASLCSGVGIGLLTQVQCGPFPSPLPPPTSTNNSGDPSEPLLESSPPAYSREKYVTLVLVLIFLEAAAFYGFVVALCAMS